MKSRGMRCDQREAHDPHGVDGRIDQVSDRVTRLGAKDVPAIERLYADGESTGESPDFFYGSMVTDGVFFGVYKGEDLIAAAGTHLVSREEGAAAIGNVYVRRDRRGRGLGTSGHRGGDTRAGRHRNGRTERPRR